MQLEQAGRAGCRYPSAARYLVAPALPGWRIFCWPFFPPTSTIGEYLSFDSTHSINAIAQSFDILRAVTYES
jgi:hypothetical protein